MNTIFEILDVIIEDMQTLAEPSCERPTRPALDYIMDSLALGKKKAFAARVSDELVLDWASNTGAKIIIGDHPHYVPKIDEVRMPPRQYFSLTWHSYCSALLHEMAHWTGHTTRLNRELFRIFEIEDRLNAIITNVREIAYCEEEIIAELVSAQLCLDFGVRWDSDQSASYISKYLFEGGFRVSKVNELAEKAEQAVRYLKRWQFA